MIDTNEKTKIQSKTSYFTIWLLFILLTTFIMYPALRDIITIIVGCHGLLQMTIHAKETFYEIKTNYIYIIITTFIGLLTFLILNFFFR